MWRVIYFGIYIIPMENELICSNSVMIDNHSDDRQKLHGARERQRGSTENALDTARLGKARLRACLAAAFSLTRHARQEAQTDENSAPNRREPSCGFSGTPVTPGRGFKTATPTSRQAELSTRAQSPDLQHEEDGAAR